MQTSWCCLTRMRPLRPLILIGMLVWCAYSMFLSDSESLARQFLQNQNTSTYCGCVGLVWIQLVQVARQLVVCTCSGSFLRTTPLALLLVSLIQLRWFAVYISFPPFPTEQPKSSSGRTSPSLINIRNSETGTMLRILLGCKLVSFLII